MSLQPTILPVPSEPGSGSYFRTSDETVHNESTGSHPTQKNREVGTKKLPDDPEKVLSSEDEFPDGGLKAWTVVLGVGPYLLSKGHTNVIAGCVLYSNNFRLRECLGCTRMRFALRG